MRFPRAFYGKEKFYTQYIQSDAEILFILHNTKINKTVLEFDLLSAFDIQIDEKKDDWFTLALTLQGIVWWDTKKNKMAWWIKPENIANIGNSENVIKIDAFKTTPELKVNVQ